MRSTLSTVTFLFGWISFVVSISATVSLMILIETRSRKEFGGYKNFLRIYSMYAFCFAMIDWLVQPVIIQDIHGFGYAFYSENRMFDLGYDVAHFVQVLYCGCFIASSSFLSLNFIYRYVSCCRKHLLTHFQGFGLFLIFLYCALPFIIWSLCVHFLFGPTSEKTAYLSLTTMKKEGVGLSGKPYVGPMCRHFSTTTDHNVGDINWPTMGAMLGLCGFQALFYAISLICGIGTYQYNRRLFKLSQLSKNLYRIQMQLRRRWLGGASSSEPSSSKRWFH